MDGYTFENTLEAKEYQLLRKSVGWPALPDDEAASGLEHSSFICACHLREKIVGAVRLIWDHGYIVYFSDLMVLPEYQGQGIGMELAKRALAWVRQNRPLHWKIKIVLIATRNNEGFYKKLGFVERPCGNMGPGMDLWIQPDG